MIDMFFITYSWNNYDGFEMKNYFYCDPENCFNFCNEEFPMIFPNIDKKKNVINKKINISLHRRMLGAAEIFIEFDELFSQYEIQVFDQTNSVDPFISAISDRKTYIACPLKENVCYIVRVRGVNKEDNCYTKWSDECSFYSLKSK